MNMVYKVMCDLCLKHWEYVATPEEVEYGVTNDTMTCDDCACSKSDGFEALDDCHGFVGSDPFEDGGLIEVDEDDLPF